MPFEQTPSLTFNEWESPRKSCPSSERSPFEKASKLPPPCPPLPDSDQILGSSNPPPLISHIHNVSHMYCIAFKASVDLNSLVLLKPTEVTSPRSDMAQFKFKIKLLFKEKSSLSD